MESKRTAVFGIYPDLNATDAATHRLVRGGFLASDVSVLIPENLGPRPIATEKATKAPEGAAAGAGSGAVLGGALGVLAGIGALAIPGAGPFIAAGPLVAGLAGLGAGGAIGGLAGALLGMGIPEFEAKRYEGRLKTGGVLLSIHCDTSEEIKRAKEIMAQSRAEDVSSTGESYSPDPKRVRSAIF